MTNSNRNFVKILHEICKKHHITIRSFGVDWIFELQKYNQPQYIVGYEFPDLSSSKKICDDKSALSEILSAHHIPNVRHVYFMNPKDIYYINEVNWKQRLLNVFDKFDKDVVIKPNSGTGGESVFRIKNKNQLLNKVNYIFKANKHVALAPFLSIDHEYRAVVYKNKVQLVFDKQRISSWKHNLAYGSKPIEITNKQLISKIAKLASQVTSLLKIRFASVDIVEVNNKLIILEINSGVMLERFSAISQQNYLSTKTIYENVILDFWK